MPLTINRATVLGSGTMGSQIAALLADHGVSCDLLDLPAETESGKLRNHLAEEAKRRLLTRTPSPISGPEALELVRPGNFEDDLPRLAEADWVIEAVLEKLDVKRAIWAHVAPHLRSDAIASSNTSGIPIASIGEALPAERRKRFLGAHFFNPPRYLRLLELTPTRDTDAEVLRDLQVFAEQVLDRGVVIAHDVPNFVANRVGCYGMMVTVHAMKEFGLGPDEVDGITGTAMGRPRSATFRTIDLVGVDVLVDICDNMQGYVSDPSERSAFEVPRYVRRLVERGWTGEKSGQGFYRRAKRNGETEILVLDPGEMEYRPRGQSQSASLSAVAAIDDAGGRLRALMAADDVAGLFAWRVLSRTLAYAAHMVGEVADDFVSIDRAMRWGFGWDMGPFETWDALGVAETTGRMREDGLDVPDWVVEIARDSGRFYGPGQGEGGT